MSETDKKTHPKSDAPPPPTTPPATPPVREALDAENIQRLQDNPRNKDAKLDVAIDESFPASDPPSQTQPAHGKKPAPSTGGGD